MENLRIWAPSVLPSTYQNFQELRPYYNLGVVDTDRYLDEGTPRQVMLAVRELEELELARDDWENQRLIYTHGVGAVANAAAVVQEDGQPQFLLQDVPPVASVDQLELEQPRVYFGETYEPGRPVIVVTGDEPQEIDYPVEGEGTAFNEYDGAAGVRLSSIWQRIAFAFRYRDLNLLISGEIQAREQGAGRAKHPPDRGQPGPFPPRRHRSLSGDHGWPDPLGARPLHSLDPLPVLATAHPGLGGPTTRFHVAGPGDQLHAQLGQGGDRRL